MSTEAAATHPRSAILRRRLLPFAGVTSAGWLIGTYTTRAAALGSCDDFGQRGCTGADFVPSLIGLAGLVLLLTLIAGAVAADANGRAIPALAGTLLYAGGIATVAARTEPATHAAWYVPTTTTVALAVLLSARAAFTTGRHSPATPEPTNEPTHEPTPESGNEPGNEPTHQPGNATPQPHH